MRHTRTIRNARTKAAMLAVAAIGALTLAACSSGTTEPTSSTSETSTGTATTGAMEMTPITVGVIPILDVAPLYLGISQGFFADAGLEVTTELAQGGAAIVPGVTSGQFQFGFSNTTSLILATANGISIQAVAPGVSSTGVDGADFGSVLATADSGITSPADLAGKKIAVNTLNNINTSTINKMVSDAGGDPSTITYVELAFPDIVPAIVSGDVDAGQVVEPFQTVGEGQGLVQVGSNYALTDPNLMIAEYFTSSDYATANPDIVSAFQEALTKSFEYATANPDAVRAALADYTSMDEATQQAVTLPAWNTTIDDNTVDLLAQLAVKDGFLTEVPDLTGLK
ncbi:ABC transporter substrate-binding protein [Demequina capsici]|uniref:ABC transporter substrate-binding protein n=1 Tax=Demequina capsici TaxID=3075620 RepID=A0AA96FA51_9MICO|nr:ABC transporter substrate-binding protein [Demequina sp. OYTSA14]WNM24971.1 ABC transporter substrate-binding protein [Demequina sp. OYTSA14]